MYVSKYFAESVSECVDRAKEKERSVRESEAKSARVITAQTRRDALCLVECAQVS